MAFDHRANHVMSPRRAAGGRLSVEADRLVFRPHGVDRALRAKEWSVLLADVAAARVAGVKAAQLFSGGLRPRLEIEIRGGDTQLFVISSPKRRAAELTELVA